MIRITAETRIAQIVVAIVNITIFSNTLTDFIDPLLILLPKTISLSFAVTCFNKY